MIVEYLDMFAMRTMSVGKGFIASITSVAACPGI